MKTTYVCLLSLGIIFGIYGCSSQPSATEQAIETNDERFEDDMEEAAEALTEAFSLNNKILTASQMAANQTSIPENIKSLAQQLQTDHQQVGQQLQDLGGKYNVALPQAINYDELSDIGKLRETTQEEFTNEFVELIESASEEMIETVKELGDEAGDVNTDMADFAEQLVPTLEAHQNQLDELEDSM